jgi:hypothetical protein
MKNINSSAQPEQNKTSEHTIKFHHHERGETSFINGETVYANLFMIGAFSQTKKPKFSGNDAGYEGYEYQTDLRGLSVLQSRIEEAVEYIGDAVSLLGQMLAHVDKEELGDQQLDTYAWLVTGLGELTGQLSRELMYVSDSRLRAEREAATKLTNISGEQEDHS